MVIVLNKYVGVGGVMWVDVTPNFFIVIPFISIFFIPRNLYKVVIIIGSAISYLGSKK